MGHHHHRHHHNEGHACEHAHSRKKRLGLTIAFNIVITVAEFAGGLLSGSLALLSDAAHNLSDVLALLFGYLGEKASERRPDLDYSFGLKRFEVITAVINALALCGVGIFILIEAYQRWQSPVEVNLRVMLPIAVIGLAGNLLSIMVLGRHDTSINVRAAFLHLLYDTVSSVAVIATGIAMHFTKAAWLDPVISVIIVIMIGVSSFEILLEALRIILQVAPKHVDTRAVHRSILESAGAADVHGLHIWSVNSSEIFLSCHVCMDADPGSVEGDSIITRLNDMLKKRFGISHTTIQIEAGRFCVDHHCCCENAN